MVVDPVSGDNFPTLKVCEIYVLLASLLGRECYLQVEDLLDLDYTMQS
jgi:hypothetical protein